jgi:hypothetical protein
MLISCSKFYPKQPTKQGEKAQAAKTKNRIGSSSTTFLQDIPDLEKILSDVIESLHPKTFEIKSRDSA